MLTLLLLTLMLTAMLIIRPTAFDTLSSSVGWSINMLLSSEVLFWVRADN